MVLIELEGIKINVHLMLLHVIACISEYILDVIIH